MISVTDTYTALPPDAPPPPPTPCPPGYKVLRELGRGGMGVVYEATQLSLNRPVALKTMRDGGLADGPSLHRFLAEAETVARLKHPNIVQVFDYGRHDNRPYMVMEYLAGGSLADHLKKQGKLSAREAGLLMEEIASGVAAAHGRNVIHRDLKPGNILFDEERRPKVADFGLSKRIEGDGDESEDALGTPLYMAPEQIEPRNRFVGPAADVWSLGVILFECASGKRPFLSGNYYDIFHQIIEGPVPTLRSQAPDVPADLSLICRKCMEKDPTLRYASASELADDLRNWREGKAIAARPPSTWYVLATLYRRNRFSLNLAAAWLVVGALAALYSVYRISEESRNARDSAEKARVAKELAEDNGRKETEALASLKKQQGFTARLNADLAGHASLDGSPRDALTNALLAWRFAPPDDRNRSAYQRMINANLAEIDRKRAAWRFPFEIVWAGFAGDDSAFLAAGADGRLSLRAVGNGETIAEWNHGGPVTAAALAADGATAASGGKDGRIVLWKVGRREPVREWKLPRTPTALALDADGGRVFAADECPELSLFKSSGAEPPAKMKLESPADEVAFGVAGALLFREKDRGTRRWQEQGGNPESEENTGWFQVHEAGTDANVLYVSPDDLYSVNVKRDGVNRYRTAGQKPEDVDRKIELRKAHRVRAVAFSPDCRLYALVEAGGKVEVRQVAEGPEDLLAQLPRRPDAVAAGAAAGSLFAALGTSIIAYDAVLPPRVVLSGVNPRITALAVSADESRIAYATADGTVRICDHRGKELSQATLPKAAEAIAFRSDGLEAKADGQAYLWDFRAPPALQPPTVTAAELRSPDGRTLLETEVERGRAFLRLRDAVTRLLLVRSEAAAGEQFSMAAFTTDGRAAIAVDSGNRLRRWPVPSEVLQPGADGEAVLARLADLELGREGEPKSEGEFTLPGPAGAAKRDWSLLRAGKAEAEGRQSAALFHLNRLVVRDPSRRDWLERRAAIEFDMDTDADADAKMWNRAAADYAKLAESDPGNALYRNRSGMARLKAIDMEGYRKACREMMAAFGASTDKEAVRETAWLALADRDSGIDPKAVLAMLDRLPDSADMRDVRGAAYYRAGLYLDAVKALERGPDATESSNPRIELLMAMAFQRLALRQPARRALAGAAAGAMEVRDLTLMQVQAGLLFSDARTFLGKQRFSGIDRVILPSLLAEAERLMGGRN